MPVSLAQVIRENFRLDQLKTVRIGRRVGSRLRLARRPIQSA
jgi:hypothetical protein